MKRTAILSFAILAASVCVLCGCEAINVDIGRGDSAATTVTDTALPDESEDVSLTTEPAGTTTAATTFPEITTPPQTTTVLPETTAATTTAVPETEAPETTTEFSFEVKPMKATMYATASTHVRTGPATFFDIVGYLHPGDEIEVTGVCDNGWYRIKFKDGEYYVGWLYVSEERPGEKTSSPTDEEAIILPDESGADESFEIADEFMAEVTGGILEYCPEEYSEEQSGREYGELVVDRYYSDTCGRNRPVNIILPAGYDESRKYPVLYVLHGMFGNEYAMMNNNRTHIILGNMMAQGLAEDMIIVFPYIYAGQDKNAFTDFTAEDMSGYDNFLNDLVNDLMPYMTENYSIAQGKDNTAVLGFSIGGREALAIGFTYPDMFGYIGAVCPVPGLTPSSEEWNPGQLSEEELSFGSETPYLIMVGAAESDSVVSDAPESYHDLMVKNGVEHIFYIIPGSDHGDPAIASVTYNFCKHVFKAK